MLFRAEYRELDNDAATVLIADWGDKATVHAAAWKFIVERDLLCDAVWLGGQDGAGQYGPKDTLPGAFLNWQIFIEWTQGGAP